MWAANNIASPICLFYLLYCDIISLISLKITQAFHLLHGFAEINYPLGFLYVRITEGSDNGDSDNRGCTVLQNILLKLKKYVIAVCKKLQLKNSILYIECHKVSIILM